MKLPSLKVVLLTPFIGFALFYIVGVILISQRDYSPLQPVKAPSSPLEIAILGATGTAGDGILKAALESINIGKIRVITRRMTPRIQAGVDAGKVEATIHTDYLDYSTIQDQLVDLDAVYWAIGISSLGADEKTYRMIHTEFPVQFIKSWTAVSLKSAPSFHFISSSDISEDSNTMWVREKIFAERTLFALTESTKLNVIAYRPDYIGPTTEEASIGQSVLYWFFKPVGAAVKASEIGLAMIDVTLRKPKLENGSKLSTAKILLHSRSKI